MNNLHVHIKNENALSLAGSWEDQRSAQEIVMDIRESRSHYRVTMPGNADTPVRQSKLLAPGYREL
jgi:hypothetical protein